MKVCDLALREIHFGEPQFLVIGGRPAMGKTTFAISMARALATQGYKICYFSLAESPKSWLDKYSGKYSKGDNQGNNISENISFIEEVPQNPDSIESYCRDHQYDLIIIDYLQLIDRGDGRVKDVERLLRDVADRYSRPIIVLSQLSRKTDLRKDHKPRISDLESKGLASGLFDQVFLLYREHYYDIDADESDITVILKDAEEHLTWDYSTLSVF